jgi:hypothetical protein
MVTWIAVFEGYDCQPTSEGIAATTTLTVVYSSVSTLVLDFFLTVIMFKLHRLIMQHRSIEIVVGAFILAGVLSVAILAVRVSGFNVGSDAPTYRVTAHFENVGGLVV